MSAASAVTAVDSHCGFFGDGEEYIMISFNYDRYHDSTDPYDDSNVLARASFNFTIALYDAETDILYYCEFDT